MGSRGPAPKDEARRQRERQGEALQPKVLLLPLRHESPQAPAGLSKAQQAQWRDYWASDVGRAWQDSDADSLHRLIVYRDEWGRLMRAHQSERFVAGSMGQPRVNPALGEALKLEAAIAKLSADLGLTPASRLRLGISFGMVARTIEDLRSEAGAAIDDDDPRLTSLPEAQRLPRTRTTTPRS